MNAEGSYTDMISKARSIILLEQIGVQIMKSCYTTKSDMYVVFEIWSKKEGKSALFSEGWTSIDSKSE